MKIAKLTRSKKGAGMIEVVVSMALLTLLAVFIITVFASATQFVYRNAASKQKDKQLSSGIENSMAGFDPDEDSIAIGLEKGALEVNFSGVVVEIDGQVVESTGGQGELPYYYYHANP